MCNLYISQWQLIVQGSAIQSHEHSQQIRGKYIVIAIPTLHFKSFNKTHL